MDSNMTPVLNDQTTADLVLLIHDTRVYAHRDYLCRVSEHYNLLLSWYPKEEEDREEEVKILDYDYETIYSYLRYLYTGKVKLNEENIESMYDLSVGYLENSR